MVDRFTVYEFYNYIESVFLKHPFINSFFPGKYRINSSDNVCYPASSVAIRSISRNGNSQTFEVDVFYVDRLTESRDNKFYIQSTGYTVINDIMNAISISPGIFVDKNFTSYPFIEQFADNCAGVYATINITTPAILGDCTFISSCDHCN